LTINPGLNVHDFLKVEIYTVYIYSVYYTHLNKFTEDEIASL